MELEDRGGVYAIIVAGGSGSRMNSATPKQFLEINGKPILMHSIEKFTELIPEVNIIVVLLFSLMEQWKSLCIKHHFSIPHQLVNGGETRFHSVKNALSLVPENCLVGIHDAARPLVNNKTINNAFKTAEIKGNAIPVMPLNDSIREVKNNSNFSVDRRNYFIIQTPQCFQSSLIKNAFLRDYNTSFTDDASVLEAMGVNINLIEGNPENVKITTPIDFVVATALLNYSI